MPDCEGISPQTAIRALSDATGGQAIVTLGVGQHQMWAMQYYQVRQPRSFLSSSGFGTMGYGLPAAIGAKVAAPERQVLDIDGDGSLNMTIHELSTCHRAGKYARYHALEEGRQGDGGWLLGIVRVSSVIWPDQKESLEKGRQKRPKLQYRASEDQ